MIAKPINPEWLQRFLELQGFKIKKVGDWFMTNCPFHQDDTPSFGVHIYDGGYNCFTCHKSGSFLNLIDELKLNINILPDIDAPTKKDYERIKQLKNKNVTKPVLYKKTFIIFSRIKLKRENLIYNYALSRGINEKTIERLNIGYNTSELYSKRLVIPVYNNVGKLLWFEGRAIKKNIAPKYWRPAGSPVHETLYNYHKIRDKSYVIVVEGILDSILLDQWNFSSVCCFGSKLHIDQLIQLINFEKVYLCFDGDKAGIQAFREVKKKIKGDKSSYFFRIPMPMNKDIGDLNRKEFLYQFNQKKII